MATEQCTFALNVFTGFRNCVAIEPEPSQLPWSLVFRPNTSAIAPVVFLPVHFAMFHFCAMGFPAKHITYPLLASFNLVLYAAEHFTAELPTLAEALPALSAIAQLNFALSFYFAYKTTESKRTWAAGLALFLIGLLPFVACDLGIPKDVVSDQKLANFEQHYTWWHMFNNILIDISSAIATAGVPWAAAKAPATLKLKTPSSPRHTTLSLDRRPPNPNLDCASPLRRRPTWPSVKWEVVDQVVQAQA